VSAPALLRLRAGDDVVITTRPVRAGEQLDLDGEPVVADQDILIGYKVAARDLAVGEVVRRLGTPIGRITAATRRGAVVHVHNLESQYLRTHARGEQ
jgi:hypothetical protein